MGFEPWPQEWEAIYGWIWSFFLRINFSSRAAWRHFAGRCKMWLPPRRRARQRRICVCFLVARRFKFKTSEHLPQHRIAGDQVGQGVQNLLHLTVHCVIWGSTHNSFFWCQHLNVACICTMTWTFAVSAPIRYERPKETEHFWKNVPEGLGSAQMLGLSLG